MIKRKISSRLSALSKKIPIVAVTGPRQSGKTTLIKSVFPNYRNIRLENPDNLDFALSDTALPNELGTLIIPLNPKDLESFF